jgi:hypothetical protein
VFLDAVFKLACSNENNNVRMIIMMSVHMHKCYSMLTQINAHTLALLLVCHPRIQWPLRPLHFCGTDVNLMAALDALHVLVCRANIISV